MPAKKKAAKTSTETEPIKLEVLAPAQFATHKAVRAFVAAPAYRMLMLLVSEAANPSGEVPPDDRDALLRRARVAAGLLADDLSEIAHLAAAKPRAFVPPVTSRGWYFSQRAAWLALLLASAVSSEWTEPNNAGMVDAIAAQLDAIESEEAEAWREAARGEAA